MVKRKVEVAKRKMPKLKREEEEIFCFCREEAEGFMIKCDECNIWFHGRCLRLKKESCKGLEQWYCIACTQKVSKSGIGDVKQIQLALQKINDGIEHLNATSKIIEVDSASTQAAIQNFKVEIKLFLEEKLRKDLHEVNAEVLSLRKCNEELDQSLKIKGSEVDSIQRERASDQDELVSVREAFQSIKEEKRLLEEKLREELSKAYTEILLLKECNEELRQSLATNKENTVVDSFHRASNQELVNDDFMNFKKEKTLLEEELRELKKELEEAYGNIRSLRSSNNELTQRLTTFNQLKRSKLSLSQRYKI